MNEFVKAVGGMKHSVIYTDTEGRYFRFSGGTWAWRNHNLGNVRPKRHGKFKNQIGVTKHLVIFSDDQSGHEALIEVLKTVYGNSSIDQMIEKYAPPIENPTKKYAKLLHEKTGVMDNTKIQDFTEDQFEKLWKAVQQMEGYKPGVITELFHIDGIQIIKNQGYQFHLNENNWISTAECIALAKQGKVELEVCISQMGSTFLRSPPNSYFQTKLKDLIRK